ncbi:hypothetical protein JB92DRAFT_3021620 [Gautieria morchelliformis]|nr:hypothetical protein JB92DRAFT_3021620 [Gautieria morchelliformis]
MRVDLLGQLTDYLIHMLHTSLNLDQVLFLALHGSCKFFMGSLKSFYLLLYRRQRNRLEDVTIRLHCGNRGLRFGQRIATGYFTTWNMTNATPGLTIFEAGGPWITAYFVLTMATNLYCTSKSHIQ